MKIAQRPLNDHESAVLNAILSVDFEGVQQLREQSRGAMVVGLCDCGCPTVSLAVLATAPVADLSTRLTPAWGRVVTDGHEAIGQIVLVLSAGRLDSLEFIYYDAVPPTAWPPLDQINIVTLAT